MAARFVALTFGTLLLAAAPAWAKEPAAQTSARDEAPAADETLTLKKGAKQVLTVPGLSRVALGDPSVADVRTTGKDGVELSALAKGTTTLIVWGGDGKRRTYRIVVDG
ncbi:pilus assembly protein N-terminal domain-containing protein [Corallococcus macrosporus]|uniref:Pilus assembly protein N-terminal domain-containing protein n=1 Tax=Corallococcus macrosporus TaxID=35 RepID=A0ABS3DEI9_9BACT|nr:pilus assembly protein N-terminal domain-containing protein [Corallococcus macrosporus]MBN8230094.1 pilus assembly protein N-terminal domain-containing protein [Corallococcus macrosporus]